MALTTCGDCKAEISDAAPACPKCGRPMATATAATKAGKGGTSFPTALGIGMLGVGVYLFFTGNAIIGAVVGGFGFLAVILLSRKSSA